MVLLFFRPFTGKLTIELRGSVADFDQQKLDCPNDCDGPGELGSKTIGKWPSLGLLSYSKYKFTKCV